MISPLPLPIDLRIADLRSTLERTRANLIELDADVTRKTLESSTALDGRTAAAWDQASGQFAALWQGQLALDTVLEEITVARGTRPAVPRSVQGRLHELLDGTPVALTRSGPDAANRTLTEGTTPTEHCSIDEVISRMSVQYETVMAVVNAVSTVWTETLPELETLRSTVTELEAEAASSGGRLPNQLGQARRVLDEQEAVVRHDPLTFDPDALPTLRAVVVEAGRPLREAIDATREVAGELQAVQASLDHCRQALARIRTERDRPTAKVAVPDRALAGWDGIEAAVTDLQGRLDAAGRIAAIHPVDARHAAASVAGAVGRLGDRLADLDSLESTGVATRDELRGRLAALRAKAQAMGHGEEPTLDRIYDEAREVLFSAPCHVEQAEGLVARFQQALRSLPGGTG